MRGAALCPAFAPLLLDILPNVSTLYLLLLSLASSFDGTYLICRTHYCVTDLLFVSFFLCGAFLIRMVLLCQADVFLVGIEGMKLFARSIKVLNSLATRVVVLFPFQ